MRLKSYCCKCYIVHRFMLNAADYYFREMLLFSSGDAHRVRLFLDKESDESDYINAVYLNVILDLTKMIKHSYMYCVLV